MNETINGLPTRLMLEISTCNVLFSCHRGSLAHGMYVPSTDPDSVDDTDYFACVVGPREHYIGLTPWGNSETKEVFIGDDDLLVYEIRKLARLMKVCNPNVLSFLWMEEYLYKHPMAQPLFEIRDDFISKDAVFKSFCGYAHAQLKKMNAASHRGFRGDKRKELKERFGYDTKHASHCVRLLRMGEEFLRTGFLRVNRQGHDADELIAIKTGEWSLDKICDEANRYFGKMKLARDVSKLPNYPNHGIIEEVVMSIVSKEMAGV